MRNLLFILTLLVHGVYINAQTVSGELKKWHTVTIEFTDDETYTETGATNPVFDRRLNVTFTSPTSVVWLVPGYFAADGDAAETSATSGDKYHVKFSPNEEGLWTYSASFREGTAVAATYPSSPTDGSASTGIDGDSGNFTIGATDKTGRDFRGKGRLQYDNTRYPKFAETGEAFIKAGPDSPENFLAYTEFDDTFVYGGTNFVHPWTAHSGLWQSGDPLWQTTKGTGIIGALRYLESKGMNSVSFLTMSKRRGDSKDITMHVDTPGVPLDGDDYDFYDVSKTAQWNIVFEFAQELGIFLHVKSQEQENATQLDETSNALLDGDGSLDNTRKVYFRELIARFGHNLALNWNMGEENEGGASFGFVTGANRISQLNYVNDIDPYGHLRVVHSGGSTTLQDAMYDPLKGGLSELTGVSLQTSILTVHDRVKKWVDDSEAAGKAWVVSSDETAAGATDDVAFRQRKIYASLFAGAYGFEIYKQGDDQDLKDFSSGALANVWDYCKYAIDFMALIPFTEMNGDDTLISGTGNIAFAKVDDTYAAYLPSANGNPTINLANNNGDTYTVKWYDVRNGGALVDGTVASVTDGGLRNVGAPPNSTTSDWVFLATNDSGSSVSVTSVSTAPATASINVGGTVQLTETVLPAGATDKTGLWSTTNAGVATVSSSGLVSGVSAGSATITFTTTDESFNDDSIITVNITITVTGKAYFNNLNITGQPFLGGTKINSN